MTHINQIQKKNSDADKKIPEASGLVKKKQIIVLKLVRQKVKYLVLVVQLLLLH